MRGNRLAFAVLIVLAVIAAALLTFGQGDDPAGPDDAPEKDAAYDIVYVLDGGVQNPLNPTSYVPGTTTELHDPRYPDDLMVFDSWYLDSGLTQPVESIGADFAGDLTLYAGWSESLSGKGLEFLVSGTYSGGTLANYTVGGSVSYEYLSYDPDRGYLRSVDRNLEYTSALDGFTDAGTEIGWTGEDGSDAEWSLLGKEGLDTVYGPRECEVYRTVHDDGTVETQWIAEGWIPCMAVIDFRGPYSQTYITLTLLEVYDVEPRDSVRLSVFADRGLTVTGSGSYTPGETVTVSATTGPGTTFDGWYDRDGELLSRSSTMEVDVGAEDLEVYAMNTADPDLTLQGAGTVSDPGLGMVGLWTVHGPDGTSETFEGFVSDHVFAPGGYLVTFEDPDGLTYLVFSLTVDGYVTVPYEWSYGGRTYLYDLDILYSDLLRYRGLYDVSQRCQDVSGNHVRDATFATCDDRYVVELAAHFSSVTAGWSDQERVGFVLSFCQSVGYEDDRIHMGHEEYWKFPVETLYDHGGDCEDTSILMASICRAMGYDSALLIFPGHMAAGVHFLTDDGGLSWFYLLSDPAMTEYYYCETTSAEFSVGVRPAGLDTSTVYIVIV